MNMKSSVIKSDLLSCRQYIGTIMGSVKNILNSNNVEFTENNEYEIVCNTDNEDYIEQIIYNEIGDEIPQVIINLLLNFHVVNEHTYIRLRYN